MDKRKPQPATPGTGTPPPPPTIYLPLGEHKGWLLIQEHEPYLSVSELARDIWAGQMTDVIQVLACTSGGSCDDITEQVRDEVLALAVKDYAAGGVLEAFPEFAVKHPDYNAAIADVESEAAIDFADIRQRPLGAAEMGLRGAW